MRNIRGLCLAHFWIAFAAFLVACILGAWQMWVRSPLGAQLGWPELYYMSVTAHGVAMAYVLTTFFILGFGYFVAVTSLERPLPGLPWAWAAFWVAVAGVILTVIPIAMGRATVLFTFYPPLTASAFFYIGLVLVVVASWVWCLLMLVAMQGNWGTHYDARPSYPPQMSALGWWVGIGLVPQLFFWIHVTIVLGALFGIVAAAVARRRGTAAA